MEPAVAAFWAVLFGFLVVDALVFAPAGGAVLGVDRRGRPGFDPWPRQALLGRAACWVAPLNPFACAVRSTAYGGAIRPAEWRGLRAALRRAAPAHRRLAAGGSAYLVALALLAALSSRWPFARVLPLLVAAHAAFWAASALLAWRHRHAWGLEPHQVVGALVEAAFVPAYVVNLGRRLALRRTVALPALAVGLQQLRRMPEGPDREARLHHWRHRVDEWATDAGVDERSTAPDPDPAAAWVSEARRCAARLAAIEGEAQAH